MKTERLKTNQLTPQAFQWYLDYLACIDAKDLDRFGRCLTDNCELQINNGPWIRNKGTILDTLNAQWMTFDSLAHDLLNIFGTDASFALEAVNHYRRNDGKQVAIPTVVVTERNDAGLVFSIRVYGDFGPLSSTDDD